MVDYSYDLKDSTKRKFGKQTLDLKGATTTTPISFTNDIEGQVVYAEKGNNIVITAYDVKDDVYTMVTTDPKTGTTKYIQTTYKYDDSITEGSKWVKQKTKTVNASAETKYYKNGEEYEGSTYVSQSVNTKKTLGTVTIKNGNLVEEGGYASLKYLNTNIDNLLTQTYAPVKSGNKYTGTYLNESIDSSEKNETFALSTGNDIIYYDLSKSQGKDTINLVKGATLTLIRSNGAGLNPIQYAKSGNNAVITETKTHYLEYQKAKYDVAKNAESSGEHEGEYKVTLKTAAYNQSTGKYDDYGAEQTVYYTKEALNSLGLKTGKIIEQYQINTDGEGWVKTTAKAIKGYPATSIETISQVTLKDYYKLNANATTSADAVTVYYNSANVNNELAYALDYSSATKKQTINDGFLLETIYGSKYGDKITSSAEDDIITGGAGNDTINLTNGDKTLNFAYGSGKDTVTVGKNATADIIFANDTSRSQYYTLSGKNLIINSDYAKIVEAEEVIREASSEQITVKNFFKGDDFKAGKLKVGSAALDMASFSADHSSSANYFDYVGSDSKKNTIKGTAYNDRIVAGAKTTSISAGEGNNILTQFAPVESGESIVTGEIITMSAGKGNDIYNVTDLGTSVDINDKGGSDVLNIVKGEESGVFAVFDVMANGKKPAKYNDLTTLRIVNNDFVAADLAEEKFDGLSISVNIKNYFKTDGQDGAGKIETINYGGNALSINVDEITSGVQSWLTTHSDYNSAYDVLRQGDKEDIASLLEVYGYTPSNNVEQQ